jgi:hypothetical protein
MGSFPISSPLFAAELGINPNADSLQVLHGFATIPAKNSKKVRGAGILGVRREHHA